MRPAPHAPTQPLSPRSWGRSLSKPPMQCSDTGQWSGPLLRWWRNVDPDISQPVLDHHYLTMHLGGAKRVERRGGGGATRIVDLESGALSIMPAGSAYDWSTRGPIEFAHLYLAPCSLDRLVAEEFDRDPSSLSLEDRVGVRDPLLQTLFLAMLEESAGATAVSRLYLDTLLQSLMMRLVRNYGNVASSPLRPTHSLPPARLRRVLDFMQANLAADIKLADLASVAASSPFHFSRSFAAAAGAPPYAYLLGLRIEAAKVMLATGSGSVQEISESCGFNSAAQFSRTFKRLMGTTPGKFRTEAG